MNTRESFRVRPYQEAELADCTTCLYESFFTCPSGRDSRWFTNTLVS